MKQLDPSVVYIVLGLILITQPGSEWVVGDILRIVIAALLVIFAFTSKD